ncbi:MAG TPA: AsmA-like C-terminal region-containing protein [Vicinamibacterales bacterium]
MRSAGHDLRGVKLVLKKILLVGVVVVVVGSLALFVWARSVFSQDAVRTTIAAKLSDALGQPVTIGGIGASIYPSVAVDLDKLSIGPNSNITVAALRIATDFRALLSRRIEHGSMRLSGAHIQLPLPAFKAPSDSRAPAPANATPTAAPVEIVSIDEIVLSDVEIVSNGRTLRGDIEVVPDGKGLIVKKVSLTADKATVNVSGRITDLSGPAGELAIKAGVLDINQLLAFLSDFSKDAVGSPPSSGAPPARSATASTNAVGAAGLNMALTVDADRATIGTLSLDKLSARAKVTPTGMTLDPASFGLFGGRYEGTLALTLASVPEFHLKAKVSAVDVAAASAFAGSPGVITGKLAGDLDIAGRGLDPKSVQQTAHGTVRMDIANGVVKNLGLIQSIVVATSMRSDASSQPAGSRDEPFTHLGGTMTIAHGEGSSQNLQLVAKDVSLNLAGVVRLDGSTLDLKGQAQLSEAATQQAGKDLVRYTADQGRVTLPIKIDGSAENPKVHVDTADMAKRAIKNRSVEETHKAIEKGLNTFFKKK